MSNSYLMSWFEGLLFGNKHIYQDPPEELKPLLLRMEVENINWVYIMNHDGLTAFTYKVHGDLNTILDSIDNEWVPKDKLPLQTKAVSRFWNEFQLFLARRESIPPIPLHPEKDDDKILKELLDNPKDISFSYQSASFWGEIARRYITLRRPMNDAAPLPPTSLENRRRAMRLYDITCETRGRFYDPLSMHLVPHSEYVNAVHWQSSSLLQAFMLSNPSHTLTKSIHKLVQRAFELFFNGEKPPFLEWPEFDALIHNIQVIHSNVQEVQDNEPPKLVDVFQRLLALSYKDGLWEKDVHIQKPCKNEATGLELFLLTEKLHLAERRNHYIMKGLEVSYGTTFAPTRIENTC